MAYIWLTGLIIVICVLLYRMLSPNGRDIFCPFYFVSLLYMIIFVYGPTYYLQRGLTTVEGIEVLSYISEATFAFVMGYIFYFSGSVLGCRSLSKKQKKQLKKIRERNEVITESKSRYIVSYAWIVYFGGISFGLIYYLLTGRSIAMMLSFGQLGGKSTLSASGSYAFLVYFMDLPIAALLLLHSFIRRKNKVLVWVATIVYAIMTITAGFRYLPLCFGLAAVFLFYFIRKRRPNVFMVMLAVFAVYIFVGVIGVFRDAMKTGRMIDWSLISFETITNAFRYNSDIFFPFYVLVHMMNEGYIKCHFGGQVLYALIFWIPRFIWPSKPTSLGMRAFEAMWGNGMGGAAYPNIGEFYYEFGFVGMLALMLFFGIWIERKFRYAIEALSASSESILVEIKYAILYGYLMQFINRGDFTTWIYDLVFFLLPIWILEILLKVRIRFPSNKRQDPYD